MAPFFYILLVCYKREFWREKKGRVQITLLHQRKNDMVTFVLYGKISIKRIEVCLRYERQINRYNDIRVYIDWFLFNVPSYDGIRIIGLKMAFLQSWRIAFFR
jgi:hypothetical protein